MRRAKGPSTYAIRKEAGTCARAHAQHAHAHAHAHTHTHTAQHTVQMFSAPAFLSCTTFVAFVSLH